MSRQELSPSIQQHVEHSTASQALGVHTTEPFQPAGFQLSKEAWWQTESRISIQAVFGISPALL